MISIITPVYNGVAHIISCLESVIQQNCAQAEHLIVDGGSTDGTLDILRQYKEKYFHLKIITGKDAGQSDAMNVGITLAQGSVVGFLNVDDTYEPGVLNRILALFNDIPDLSLLVGNCNVWDTNNILMLVNRPQKLKFTELLLGQNVNPFPVNPSAYFYHKELHNIIGMYDVEEHFIMDLDFLLRAVRIANVYYVNETWGNFHLHSQTKTHIDMERGATITRQKILLNKYRYTLPFVSHLKVTILYFFYNSLIGPIRYFYHHPQEIPYRLKSCLMASISD